jgi:iron(III) transport system ATP-binding protein
MSWLEVAGLTAGYGGAEGVAVRDVGFTMAAGSLTALLGPSGCGKSTVVRVMAGLHPAAAGRFLLGGRDLTHMPAEQRPIGVLLQGGAAFAHLSVLDNVLFPLQAAGLPAADALRKAREALAIVGLAGAQQQAPLALAGGQRQLLVLARAIAQAPALLLLDEPLSNVDPRARRLLRDEIRRVQQRLGLAVLYVTHDQAEAMAVADQVVLMDAGRVVETGTPSQLYRTPRTRFAAAFMGDATTLPAVRDAHGVVRLGTLVLPGRHPGAAGAVEVSVRPEAWRMVHARLEGLPGTIARCHFLGRLMEYQVATPLGGVLVHAPHAGVPLEAGAPVSLQLAPQGAVSVLAEDFQSPFVGGA